MTRSKRISILIALSGGILGGGIIAFVGGLFGWMIASGGLYGNGQLADAKFLEMVFGAAVLLVGCLPLLLAVFFAYRTFRKRSIPRWSVYVGWIASLCLIGVVSLAALSTIFDQNPTTTRDFKIVTVILLPFALGVLGFLLISKEPKTSNPPPATSD